MKTLTIGAAALLAGAGFAQQSAQVAPVTNVRDAGTYHFATGTWSRAAETANFGPKTLYNNDINTGFFGLHTPGEEWTDDGNLPSTTGHANAKADAYVVDGLDWYYCTAEGPNGTLILMAAWEQYAACTDPTLSAATQSVFTGTYPGTPATIFGALGPGSAGPGTVACWLVTFDLAGTSLAFTINADGDGQDDGIVSIDNFGWTHSLTNAAGTDIGAGGMGPFLNGDPNNFPMGDGTYYQQPANQGTGNDTQDQFWLYDRGGLTGTGCYWFGGYINGNPYGSFGMNLYGDNSGGTADCPRYCTANPSSVGTAAISSTDSCDADGDGMLQVQATPVPNQPGIFFSGVNQIDIPFGNGHLCTGGGIVRHGVVVGSGLVATDTIPLALAPANHQYWFRDPAGGGAFYNTSDAITKE